MKIIGILLGYLWFFDVLFSDGVRVDSNLPAELVSGQRHLIEVEIDKGAIQGFSKLELSVPTGFKVMPGDVHGSSFTFSGGRARFVWMEMPSDESFTISYYIESEPGKEGAFEISGVFSYVMQNVRKDFKIPARLIKVVPRQNVVMNEFSLKDEVELVCERSITRLNETEFEVRLVVRNNNIKGFGKVLETLPAGCVARKLNDGGAVVTQDANTIKFVWFEVPDAGTFEVSYLVSCPAPCNEMAIQGQISFTENRKPYTIDVVNVQAASALTVSEGKTDVSAAEVKTVTEAEVVQAESSDVSATDAVVSKSDQNKEGNISDSNSETMVADPLVTPTNDTERAQDSKANLNAFQSKESVDNTSAETIAKRETSVADVVTQPAQGITYGVQILAAHRVVEKTYFSSRHRYSGKYNIEHHDGWIKYVCGVYESYDVARDAREEVKRSSNKLPGPFVTAYQDGARITVQEALLISNQRWIP
jgi:hypothetical protein